MIERLTRRDSVGILYYFRDNRDSDFYLTENNERKFFRSPRDIKKLFKFDSLFGIKERGDVQGLAVIWKSLGNNVVRYYLKITAKNDSFGQKLLKVVLWNFGHHELYIKISKQNKLLQTLKTHGFRFAGDRGKEILLKKDRFLRPNRQYQKDTTDGSE